VGRTVTLTNAAYRKPCQARRPRYTNPAAGPSCTLTFSSPFLSLPVARSASLLKHWGPTVRPPHPQATGDRCCRRRHPVLCSLRWGSPLHSPAAHRGVRSANQGDPCSVATLGWVRFQGAMRGGARSMASVAALAHPCCRCVDASMREMSNSCFAGSMRVLDNVALHLGFHWSNLSHPSRHSSPPTSAPRRRGEAIRHLRACRPFA
jgi:hypothetical protein